MHWLSDQDMQEDRTRERSEKFLCRDAMYFKTRTFGIGALSLSIYTSDTRGSWILGYGILDVSRMDSEVDGSTWRI